MREACSLVWLALVGLFRSRASLEAEILILRHQLNIQRRQSPKRLNFSPLDRLIFAGLYRLAPSVLRALAILKPLGKRCWRAMIARRSSPDQNAKSLLRVFRGAGRPANDARIAGFGVADLAPFHDLAARDAKVF
jgi:hypothetical protein